MSTRQRPPADSPDVPGDTPTAEAPAPSTPVEDPEKAAMDAALRLLAMRGRSRQELAAALERRGFGAELQQAVLARLEGYRYVDDARFAGERARSLLQRGRLGADGVLQRLLAHGIPEAVARQAVQSAEAELGLDPLDAARRLLDRKGLLGRPLPPREYARAARLLEARGFKEEDVLRLLGGSGLDPSQGGG